MHVTKSVSYRGVDEVPYLNALVAATSDKMTTCWMEINSTDPVLVTLTSHNVFFIFEVPDLPGAIITRCRYNLLLGMESHTTNTPWFVLRVRVDLLVHGHSLHNVVEGLGEVRIRAGIIWPRGVLALNHCVFFNPATHSLLLHTGVNLTLHFLLMLVNRTLQVINPLLQLILLQLQQRLFLNSIKVLFLYFFNFLFVVFVEVAHFLNILGYGHLLRINSVLVRLVEITLFSQFFPGRH